MERGWDAQEEIARCDDTRAEEGRLFQRDDRSGGISICKGM